MLGLPEIALDSDSENETTKLVEEISAQSNNSNSRHYRVRRQSMEQLDLIKVFFYFLLLFLIILQNSIVSFYSRKMDFNLTFF